MTIPRKLQISLEQTRYYHCVSRCVRRAYLCGKDVVSGQDYGHRRKWIENRLAHLSSLFAIDLIAYAVMHNHYHVVVRVSQARATAWSDRQVVERWGSLFKVQPGTDTGLLAPIWRERLSSISWFMRCINEPLARVANKEDGCSGRFWEGRFKLQALLDDAALYKCMVYVDLNPVRAGIATVPERSDYTSIKARIENRDQHLVCFKDDAGASYAEPLPLLHRDYLELVDWTGRMLRPDKRGRISKGQPRILDRIGSGQRQWVHEIRSYGKWYFRAVGSIGAMEDYCAYMRQRWLKGMTRARPHPV